MSCGSQLDLGLHAFCFRKLFFSGDLDWCVVLNPWIEDGDEHLSIHLHTKDRTGGDDNWAIRANFEMSVLPQSSGQQKAVYRFEDDYRKTTTGWSLVTSLPIKYLRDHGYVKDNQIQVRFDVKLVGELIKTK